jgi:hypothetical protein
MAHLRWRDGDHAGAGLPSLCAEPQPKPIFMPPFKCTRAGHASLYGAAAKPRQLGKVGTGALCTRGIVSSLIVQVLPTKRPYPMKNILIRNQ